MFLHRRGIHPHGRRDPLIVSELLPDERLDLLRSFRSQPFPELAQRGTLHKMGFLAGSVWEDGRSFGNSTAPGPHRSPSSRSCRKAPAGGAPGQDAVERPGKKARLKCPSLHHRSSSRRNRVNLYIFPRILWLNIYVLNTYSVNFSM